MKDLTHYFQSPPGKKTNNDEVNLKEENVVIEDGVEEKIDVINSKENNENAADSQKIENNESDVVTEPVKSYKGKKRGRKKKVRRKNSDPAVKNITEQLSNSLSLISPNASFSNNITEIAQKIDIIEESTVETEELSPKKNAFKFIMESRKLSIGMNYSGKEKDELSPSSKENKEKLSSRKSLLESWAEIKGASKRKRQEEEKELYIENQMQKRAKRLKNMLQVKKETTNIEINSDESNEIEEKRNSGNLLSFLGAIKKDTPEKEIIKIKMFTPKSKNNKKTRLSLKKSPEKIMNEDSSSNEAVKPKRGRKNKEKDPVIVEENSSESIKPKRGRKKKKTITNESNQDTESPITPRTASKWKIQIKNEDTQEGKKLSLRARKPKIIESDEESEEDTKTKSKKSSKIAPVFLKAAPKPKIDPEVAEARRKFLMSGIPESLKKTIEKQQSVEEKYFDVFPSIQHIQQKCDSDFWKLPKQNLKLTDEIDIDIKNYSKNSFKNFIDKTDNLQYKKLSINNEKITTKNLKPLIEEIKKENPDYPVYKSFRQIYEKSGYQQLDEDPKKNNKKRRSKKGKKSLDKSVEIVEIKTDKTECMWTEKYKPKRSDDILGNFASVKALKNFLETWQKFSKDIIKSKRKKNVDTTSESEFDVTDCDSRDSTYNKLPGNVLLLNGTVGSGKSTAVYATCKELNLKVLEINASTKRTGKKLLQDMQEATQSHQVKNQSTTINTFFVKSTKEPEKQKEPKETKMCVILIEDVDIIFDQDEGFLSALQTLVTITKRPIIMTTTDLGSPYAQKFSAQYEVCHFTPLQPSTLSAWLKIVCLVEGYLVNQNSLAFLLYLNKGDARKTLLNLQFWLQSGAQLFEGTKNVDYAILDNKNRDFNASDEPSNDFLLSEDQTLKEKPYIHTYNISQTDHKQTLGILWWNTPKLLSFPEENTKRLNKFNQINIQEHETEILTPDNSQKNLEELKKIAQFYQLQNTLAICDEIHNKLHLDNTQEPCDKNKKFLIRDSLNLDENLTEYAENYDSLSDLTQTLIDVNVKMIKNDFHCNMTLPDHQEKRWRAKNHICEDILKEATPLNTSRGPLSLDYLPYLRDMSRSEHCRSLNNTKRGKRFYHYLKTVGVDFNETSSKLACNALYS